MLEGWVLAGYPDLPDEVSSSPIPYRQAVGALLFLYLAYVVGFCARQLSFVLAEGGARRLVPWHSNSSSGDLPFKTRPWGGRYYHRAAFNYNLNLLCATFGQEQVRDQLRDHPLQNVIDAEFGGAKPANAEGVDYREVFHYCKFWLQTNCPAMSTVPYEVEVNFQLSMLLPLAVLPFVLHRLSQSLLVLTAAVVGSALAIAVLCRRANHLRHAEAFNVLRNVLFASWFVQTQVASGDDSVSSGRHTAEDT